MSLHHVSPELLSRDSTPFAPERVERKSASRRPIMLLANVLSRTRTVPNVLEERSDPTPLTQKGPEEGPATMIDFTRPLTRNGSFLENASASHYPQPRPHLQRDLALHAGVR